MPPAFLYGLNFCIKSGIIVWNKNEEEVKYMIRIATPDDAAALCAIYSHYVINTAVSFEITPPDANEFKRRIENTLKTYPYLVCEIDGKAVGYTYAYRFRDREAYDRSVETTVYLDKDYLHSGYGTELYSALEKALSLQGVTNLYACIGYPTQDDDEYISMISPEFHAKRGFTLVGRHNSCGIKFGRKYDIVWMEKIISAESEDFKNFNEIRAEFESCL